MTRRDTLKVAGATGTIAGLMGCLGLLSRDDDEPAGAEDNGGNDRPPENTDKNESNEGTPSQNQSTKNTTNETTENETNQSNETEPEYAEAANPEPNVTGPNKSEYATPEDVKASQPTVDDIAVEKGELKTDGSGATATGTLTNNHDDVISVIDVEVTFLESGKAVTSNMWGTNDLGPGESWDFEVRAEGSEYSSVDDFEIAVIL